MVKVKNDDVVRTEVEFEILEEIGAHEGRNAEVYRVHDLYVDEIRAAKRIDGGDFSDYKEYYQEARQMTDARHPNVVPVYFCGLDSSGDTDDVWILMEYYGEGSLGALHQSRQLRVEEIVEIGVQLLTGLAYIHGEGLLHFDLKPSNVLFRDDGIATITDFGLAERVDSYGVAESDGFYRPYVPPEALAGNKQTVETDIYHVGLTLWRLCNTPTEWRHEVQSAQPIGNAVMNGNFPDRDTFLPHIPDRLRRVIKKATKVNPDDRYNTAREMMNDLGEVKKYLAWQMRRSGSDSGFMDWVRKTEEKEVRCQILENGDSFEVKTQKTVNTTQHIRDACKGGINSLPSAIRFVKNSIRQHLS